MYGICSLPPVEKVPCVVLQYCRPGPVCQPACRESGAVWRKEVMRLGGIRAFIAEEDGVAVVEVVLILLVLIALVLLFKDQITRVLKSILSKAASQSDSV